MHKKIMNDNNYQELDYSLNRNLIILVKHFVKQTKLKNTGLSKYYLKKIFHLNCRYSLLSKGKDPLPLSPSVEINNRIRLANKMLSVIYNR